MPTWLETSSLCTEHENFSKPLGKTYRWLNKIITYYLRHVYCNVQSRDVIDWCHWFLCVYFANYDYQAGYFDTEFSFLLEIIYICWNIVRDVFIFNRWELQPGLNCNAVCCLKSIHWRLIAIPVLFVSLGMRRKGYPAYNVSLTDHWSIVLTGL